MSPIRTDLQFDMRSPQDIGPPTRELYAAALDMAAFAEEIGMDSVAVMEHHGSDDGYLPAPFVLGAAIAGRTKRCEIFLNAVILPLHDPVKVAEQIAVLDLTSGGRLRAVMGAGYVASEFARFGVTPKDRGRLLDEGIDLILRALNGEQFIANGREVFVRPLPIQKPEDILIIGGGVEASARRAAKFGLGMAPMAPSVFEVYEAECRRLGREPRTMRGGSFPIMLHLARDPEATWKRVMPHLRHTIVAYSKWANADDGGSNPFLGLLDDEKMMRDSGFLAVLTPEELVARARTITGKHGYLSFMPLIGGMHPDLGWESLELLKSVMPQLKAASAAAA